MNCPNCGASVPQGALSCRECGSDERTGRAKFADHYEQLSDDDHYLNPTQVSQRLPGRKVLSIVGIIVVMVLLALWIPYGIYPGMALLFGTLVYFWRKGFPGPKTKTVEEQLFALLLQ